MDKNELKAALAPMFQDIIKKLEELDEKISDIQNGKEAEYVKISDLARECGVKVQSVHYQLSHNPNIEPDKDFRKQGGKYYLTKKAADVLKKVWAKNG